jgi:RNA polymerase sigma-70 factor (ECF subfamily)
LQNNFGQEKMQIAIFSLRKIVGSSRSKEFQVFDQILRRIGQLFANSTAGCFKVATKGGIGGSAELSAAQWDAKVIAAQQGDREALNELFRRIRAYLRACALEQLDVKLQVKVSPSDVVQETLLEAHRGFAKFRGATRADLVVWLQGILNHRVQTAFRKYRGTSKRNIAREVPLYKQEELQQDAQRAAVTHSSPSGHAIKGEELAALEKTLNELPPRYEQVIRLRNELKLSFAEVAIALSCSDDAAQKLWTRAIDQLARKLNPDDRHRRPKQRPSR